MDKPRRIASWLLGAMTTALFLSCSRPTCELVDNVPSAARWYSFDGKPLVLVGDSVTQGWQELGNNFDQYAYLDALARRGISAALIWSFIGVVDQTADERIGYDAPEIWPWIKAGDSFDLIAFDDTYFRRLRSFVEYALGHRIVVVITVHDGWAKTRFAGHPFNIANGGPLRHRAEYVELADYGRQMPDHFDSDWSRYQKHQFFLESFCERLLVATSDLPNVIFEIFNEGEWYDHQKLARFQRHFAEFFAKRTEQPVMINNDHVKEDFHDNPNVDLISLHSPNWRSSSSAKLAFFHFARTARKSPPKPYFFTETVPAFDGNEDHLTAMMRLMWGTVMGGASVVVQNDTSFGFDPNTAITKLERIRSRLLDLEGHLARFFNEGAVKFSEMAQKSRLSSDCVVLANPGVEYVVYSEDGSHIRINLEDARGSFQARFYNPRTGEFQSHFVVDTAVGPGVTEIGKPDRGDWVLHLVGARASQPDARDRPSGIASDR
jgi:hypothetical protein